MILLIETNIIDNERVHSIRRLIENDRRRSLSINSLNSCIRIQKNCNNKEIVICEALKLWRESKDRAYI